jgi:hypothetical protein
MWYVLPLNKKENPSEEGFSVVSMTVIDVDRGMRLGNLLATTLGLLAKTLGDGPLSGLLLALHDFSFCGGGHRTAGYPPFLPNQYQVYILYFSFSSSLLFLVFHIHIYLFHLLSLFYLVSLPKNIFFLNPSLYGFFAIIPLPFSKNVFAMEFSLEFGRTLLVFS